MDARACATTRRLGALAVLVALLIACVFSFSDISLFMRLDANVPSDDDAVALVANTTTTTTTTPTAGPSISPSKENKTIGLRRPVVYVYDWFGYCHAQGMCEAPTVVASRKAARDSKDAELTKHYSEVDPYGPWAPNLESRAEGFHVRNTHQFATSGVYDTRLLNSAWRTRDPSKAELFYIPLEPLLDKIFGTSAYSRMKRTWMEKEVLSSPWFKRNGGRDHFLVFALCKQYINAVSRYADHELSAVTKLTIENYVYTRELDRLGRTQHQASATKTISLYGSTIYPSFLHPTAKFDPSRDACTAWESKDLYIAMSFSLRTINADSNTARGRLHAGCMGNQDICTFLPLDHFRDFNITDFEATVTMYRRAKYCIVPRGDTYTSKRFFDAVSACCVPIVAGTTRAYWSEIYKFDAFSALINRLTLLDAPFYDLANPLRYFDKLRADNGSTFLSLVPVLRDSVMPLSMALEDHPTLFDAVDLTVNALARGRILNDTAHLMRAAASS